MPNGTKATNTSSFYFYKFNSNEDLSSPEIINYIRDLNQSNHTKEEEEEE